MAGHNMKLVERELRRIDRDTRDLLKMIFQKGLTTPAEFGLILGVSRGIAVQTATLLREAKNIIKANKSGG